MPKVQPPVFANITPDDARVANAAIPFVAGPVLPARRWRFAGSEMERERALTCLTAALWWEAGDDASGQRAVAQVVINRVLHPAFPNSICSVVFQGAERTTGCQFTFTCDGALGRRPSVAAWARARAVAEAAIDGAVDRRVGTATHYHTDWVLPYWSASLDKVTAVGTHLFYRWKGWWGTPAAASDAYAGAERVDQRIAWLARPEADLQAVESQAADAAAPGEQEGPQTRGSDHVIVLDAKATPESYATRAASLCKDQSVCTVMGWINPDRVPKTTPVTPAMKRSMSFLYRRHTGLGRDQLLWNCMQIARSALSECIPGTEPDPPMPRS